MRTHSPFPAILLASLAAVMIWSSACSQARLPVIRATSLHVDICNGGVRQNGQWRISPELRPDVYTTHIASGTVAFYTDIDSLFWVIDPARPFSFVILLNGKDSAYTEIHYEPTAQLEVLKAGGAYTQQPASKGIVFRYPGANDPALTSIRNHFQLDSTAGMGSERSRVINILHWAHNSFPHDGTKDAPTSSGTEDLMTKVIAGHHTVDCGSLARILTDCYAALGYQSRRIVCLPRDSTDFDCHSITTVFLPSLGRWIWMDPTNDAYVVDEHDQLLGISEVRDRLIHDRPVRLNPDANWNHRSNIVAEEYLYSYMAKNLFALQYYYESPEGEGAVLLLPATYDGPIPRTRQYQPLCTHDPQVFWGRVKR